MPAARPLVLALDVGTSSVRALVFDSRGRPLPGLAVHLPYQPRVAADGTAEVDPDRLQRLVWRALDQIVNMAGPSARRIAAVGVSTFWHGLLAATPEGAPLTPLYLWSDMRSWGEAEELRRTLDPEAIRLRTGCPIHPSYWPAKLLWLRERRPDLWRERVRWESFGDLVFQHLFGTSRTSLSMASGTGLLETDARDWDRGLMRVLAIERLSLPEFGEQEIGLRPTFARRWPALAGIPWLLAAGDGALANLGSGCAGPDRRAITVGTSGALRVMSSEALRAPAGLWRYLLDARREVVGGAFSNGGNLYAWLARTLRVAEPGLERALSRLRPASTGLTFLPLLAGERAPGYAPRATGAIAGLTVATSPVQIVRAGLEAVAIEFARVDQRLNAGLPAPDRVVASGAGLLSSRAWLQIMADALGRPVLASRVEEASSRGAALLALEAIGIEVADERWVLQGRTFEPSAEAHQAYAEALQKQESLYRVLITDGLLTESGAPAHLHPQV